MEKLFTLEIMSNASPREKGLDISSTCDSAETCFRMTRSEFIGVPLFEVLVFLDWTSRFHAFHALSGHTVDPYEGTLNLSWVTERICQEQFVIPNLVSFPSLNKMLGYGSILDWRRSLSRPTRVLSGAVIDSTNRDLCIKSVSSCSIPRESSESGSLVEQDTNFKYYLRLKGARRAFRIDKISLTGNHFMFDESLIADFINGEDVCVILMGARKKLRETVSCITRALVERGDPYRKRRALSLDSSVYDSSFETSAFLISGHGTTYLWNTTEWPPDPTRMGDVFELISDSAGFICLQLRLVHFFTRPSVGARENVLTIFGESISRDRAPIGRDKHVISRCLLARCHKSLFIPSRESCLTKQIEMERYRSILTIVTVGEPSDLDHTEAIEGLRFVSNIWNDFTY
jgi:hypothetical protein